MGKVDNQDGKKPAQNQQKKATAQESPEEKAKRFAAVVEKYAQKNTKVTLEILGAYGAKTPADVPSDKRNDVVDALKQKITLN
jgi:archaellin